MAGELPNDFPDFIEALRETADVIAPPPTVEAPVDVGQRWPVTRTGAREPINRNIRKLIYLRDNRRCQLCHKGRCLLELDHIIPWSAGGPDTSGNLRSLCHACNTDRSNYRTALDQPAVPITLACDVCITAWVWRYGFCRYGRTAPGDPAIAAYCGNCQHLSFVTDPQRLK